MVVCLVGEKVRKGIIDVMWLVKGVCVMLLDYMSFKFDEGIIYVKFFDSFFFDYGW